MDSVLTRVSEGLERGSAALGGIINDIQYTGQVSGDRDIGSQVSRGLDSLLGPRGGSASLLLSPGHPAWRQLSLFSVWTALKVTVNKNNNKAVSNSDVQDVSLAMLGLCYLSTQPDPGEAVTVVRVVTITSVLDTLVRYLGDIAVVRRGEGELVRGLCSLAQTMLVFHMGTRILRVVLAYENL